MINNYNLKGQQMKNILAIGFLILTAWNVGAVDKINTQVVEISVTEKGFKPSTVNVTPKKSVTLKITRKTDSTCAVQVQIPSKKIKKVLPLNQVVSIDLGKLEKGEISFGCGMNMMEGGRILIK